MTKLVGIKEEHKRFRHIAISNKMHVWGEEGLTLYIDGKAKMIITLLGQVFRFCKKHQISYYKPITKQHKKRAEVWVVFKSLHEYQIDDLEYVIEKYNKARKNKVAYEVY